MPNLFRGVVTKTGAMAKTVTVTVTRKVEHPKLLKLIPRTTKFLVHDEEEVTRIGDKVTIIHGKPFSKRKHYRIASIDKAAPIVESIESKTAKLLAEREAAKAAAAAAEAEAAAAEAAEGAAAVAAATAATAAPAPGSAPLV